MTLNQKSRQSLRLTKHEWMFILNFGHRVRKWIFCNKTAHWNVSQNTQPKSHSTFKITSCSGTAQTEHGNMQCPQPQDCTDSLVLALRVLACTAPPPVQRPAYYLLHSLIFRNYSSQSSPSVLHCSLGWVSPSSSPRASNSGSQQSFSSQSDGCHVAASIPAVTLNSQHHIPLSLRSSVGFTCKPNKLQLRTSPFKGPPNTEIFLKYLWEGPRKTKHYFHAKKKSGKNQQYSEYLYQNFNADLRWKQPI
jgi:hypothetical protein